MATEYEEAKLDPAEADAPNTSTPEQGSTVVDSRRSNESKFEDERAFSQEYEPERSESDDLRAVIEKQERQLNRLRRFLDEKGFDADEVISHLEKNGTMGNLSLGARAREARDAGRLEEFFEKIIEMGGEDPELRGVEIRFKNVSVKAVEVEGDEKIQTVLSSVVDGLKGLVKRPVKHDVALIDNVSGILRPKTITLVLGPPGAGKTTLMKQLSGKLARTTLKESGEILYNGYKGDREDIFFLNKAVGYIDQHDEHLPALTVEETVRFSFDSMVEQNERMQRILSIENEIGNVVDNVIRFLGLDGCKDTIVGNEMLRGVSGGQKKRVTTAELLVGEFGAFFFDEISTGLDAATTFDEINMLRAASRTFNLTTVVSLLQPAPEVFELFDDVLLLDQGQIVYHGPRAEILGYFEHLGFRLPPLKDVADYLQEVTTEDGQDYVVDAESRGDRRPPRSTSEFVSRWHDTNHYQSMSTELASPAKEGTFPPSVKTEFCDSWSGNFKRLLGRAATLKLRDQDTVRTSVIQQIVVGGLIGGLFANLDDTASQGRYGVIFLAIMGFALSSLESLPDQFAERSVFYKQRDASFFRTTAYTLSASVIRLPQQLFMIIIWVSIVYWSTGLADDEGGRHFFVFLAVLVLLASAMEHFFQNFVAFVSSHDVAIPMSSASIVFLVLFSGFVVSEDEIDPWFIWIYWLNPVSHAFLILSQNEFLSKSFDYEVQVGASSFQRAGDVYLERQGVSTDTMRSVISAVILAAFYIIFWITATLGFHFIRHSPHHGSAAPPAETLPASDGERQLSQGPYTGASFKQLTTVDSDDVTKAKSTTGPLTVTKVDLAWQDLSYTVDLDKDNHLELLHRVTGYAKAGTCTALMGSSGAGKTTLMDVIAGRKTGGRISGKVLVNGHELDRQSFSRIIGYCEQMDIHQQSLTFIESLRFSARLRLPQETTSEDIEGHLDYIVKALDLETHRDLQVSQASQEQAKRLTIAVELAANPAVLFLDEPTSGLDARAAALVMRAIKQAAVSGRAVVATIHQPSQAIFDQFDRLLLLKRGGRTVYFGELGESGAEVVKYFSDVEESPRYKQGTNPAVYMLDCIGAGTSAKHVTSYDEVWNRSSHRVVLDEEMIKRGLTSPGDAPAIEFPGLYAADNKLQIRMCMWRASLSYFRSPEYNLTRLMIGAFVGLIFGVVFVQQDYSDFITAYSRITLIFITAMFMGIICYIASLGPAFEQRAVFYRERAANMYTASAFNTSIGIVELPYLALVALVFSSVFYFIVGFQADASHFFEYFFIVFLWITFGTYYGQFWIAAMPTRVAAMAVGTGIFQIFNLFAGFLQPAPEIPDYFIFFHYLSPLHYVFEALLFSQFYDDDTELEIITVGEGVAQTTMSQFVKDNFSTFSRDHFAYDIVVIIAFTIFFKIATFLCLAYVNHLKR